MNKTEKYFTLVSIIVGIMLYLFGIDFGLAIVMAVVGYAVILIVINKLGGGERKHAPVRDYGGSQ